MAIVFLGLCIYTYLNVAHQLAETIIGPAGWAVCCECSFSKAECDTTICKKSSSFALADSLGIANYRSSKDFPDVHALIMHAFNSDNAYLRVDHLGLHKAVCVVMGWNHMRPPDISRDYQLLPAEEVAANQDDLIMWPPLVIIHNTNTGKGPDGRMQGLGNKDMNRKIRDLGFSGAKAKSLYTKDGHLGITLMMFASDQRGLKNAMRLADHFENERHGRKDWVNVQSTAAGKDEESNPNLVLVDQKLGGRRRILYGYLATAFDLDEVDVDTRKKVTIESKCEKLQV